MNRNDIEEVLDIILHKQGFTIKCSKVSTRSSVEKAFHNVAEKYGLTLKANNKNLPKLQGNNDDLNSNIVFTLTDEKHHTRLEFTERFLEDNFIAFSEKGNHKNHTITLDEIIGGYDKLPDRNKDSVNLIKFFNRGGMSEESKLASSQFTSTMDKEMNVINIPNYYFTKYNPTGEGWDNYEFVLAHESMHCLDYIKVNDKTYDLIQKFFNGEYLEYTDTKKVFDYIQGGDSKIMTKSNGKYLQSWGKNEDYLIEHKVNESRLDSLNKASDYGSTRISEDFAEAGAMVTLGFHNPDNPKAVVRWNGGEMQYREWIKLHPYKAQYLVKQIYGENVSIDTLLGQGVDTMRNLLPTDD